jgi:hypothetical protein
MSWLLNAQSGVKAEYIVTRDISAYENSPVPAIKPAAFFEQFIILKGLLSLSPN